MVPQNCASGRQRLSLRCRARSRNFILRPVGTLGRGVRHGCGHGEVCSYFSSMWWLLASPGFLRLDVCRRFDRSFILSRHSEFDKKLTNGGNMKMEGSGPQSFVNTARFDCTCTLLLLPDELSGPDSAGVETKSFRLMVAKSLPMPSRPTFLVCAAQLEMWPR